MRSLNHHADEPSHSDSGYHSQEAKESDRSSVSPEAKHKDGQGGTTKRQRESREYLPYTHDDQGSKEVFAKLVPKSHSPKRLAPDDAEIPKVETRVTRSKRKKLDAL
jgi:hypothetical protein